MVYEGVEEFGSECILCRACVDVCPEDCLDIVPVSALDGQGDDILGDLRSDYDHVVSGRRGDVVGSVFLKDETVCIRCGLCAKRCPVGCISMQSFSVEAASA